MQVGRLWALQTTALAQKTPTMLSDPRVRPGPLASAPTASSSSTLASVLHHEPPHASFSTRDLVLSPPPSGPFCQECLPVIVHTSGGPPVTTHPVPRRTKARGTADSVWGLEKNSHCIFFVLYGYDEKVDDFAS